MDLSNTDEIKKANALEEQLKKQTNEMAELRAQIAMVLKALPAQQQQSADTSSSASGALSTPVKGGQITPKKKIVPIPLSRMCDNYAKARVHDRT